ncbi:MAG: GIY-YIG nuclease family protein [Robiginitomaculum sp.]|nr:GIY-YIG nuclease family protein [Robiginitomaculum sp.]
MMDKILVNDILEIKDLDNTKIRFVKSNSELDPIDLFKHDRETLLKWQFWNYSKKKSFKEGQITIGFVKISDKKWLLFDVSRVTKDLDRFDGVGYEHETLTEYEKYFGRVIIQYKNKSQNLVRKANSVIAECIVSHILEDKFEDDIFPGYGNVNVSWERLERVLHNTSWKTALENQKGIYLITDKSNGQKYVGSAYGERMIYGRWSDYISHGHGGNKGLKSLEFEYIKHNFNYSILEIYKSTVDDAIILKREAWWKAVLLSKTFGYNEN